MCLGSTVLRGVCLRALPALASSTGSCVIIASSTGSCVIIASSYDMFKYRQLCHHTWQDGAPAVVPYSHYCILILSDEVQTTFLSPGNNRKFLIATNKLKLSCDCDLQIQARNACQR